LSIDIVLDLDDPRCANPRLAGAKASWLARARHQGLPALPGIVLTTEVSGPALQHGTEALVRRGSGGARLEVGHLPIEDAVLAEIRQAASRLGTSLAVRSSSILEGEGEWSGAFASYLDVAPAEMQAAIAGCWASAFTVANLGRFAAVGLEPAAAPMAVLIQPVLRPEYGGVARLDHNDDVEVIGIKGSPASLVQGWESGVRAVVGPGGEVDGFADAVAYLGEELIQTVARQLRAACRLTGANASEWGVSGGNLWFLQLSKRVIPTLKPARAHPVSDSRLVDLGRLARRYPGPLGEALVLAWAAADPVLVINASAPTTPANSEAVDDPIEALHLAAREAAALTADTWGLPEPMATARAASVLRQARGSHPELALESLAALHRPDPQRAARVLYLLSVAQSAIEGSPFEGSRWYWHQPIEELDSWLQGKTRPNHDRTSIKRIGIDRWEPFQAALIESVGTRHNGVPASPGLGCGRLCFIAGPEQVEDFRPRDVVLTTNPVPNLAPLLWDAAGLVTCAGSPAAHLFETARSLSVPAVASVDLSSSVGEIAAATGRFAVAVDGSRGLVFSSEW
jgi:hypothetical protein